MRDLAPASSLDDRPTGLQRGACRCSCDKRSFPVREERAQRPDPDNRSGIAARSLGSPCADDRSPLVEGKACACCTTRLRTTRPGSKPSGGAASVHMEMYIFHATSGAATSPALLASVRRGVKVRVLWAWFGCCPRRAALSGGASPSRRGDALLQPAASGEPLAGAARNHRKSSASTARSGSSRALHRGIPGWGPCAGDPSCATRAWSCGAVVADANRHSPAPGFMRRHHRRGRGAHPGIDRPAAARRAGHHHPGNARSSGGPARRVFGPSASG